MRRVLLYVVALISTAMLTSFVNMKGRKYEKSVESMWEEYRKAERLDQIDRMADILEDIKEKAHAGRASWDFYKACDSYVNVKSRRNWKLRDSLQAQMRKEIEEYDEPLLTYFMDRYHGLPDDYLKTVQAEAPRLRQSRIDEAYEGMVQYALKYIVRNDYEFVLWDILRQRSYADGDSLGEIYSVLSEEVAGVYPQQGVLDYHYALWAMSGDERESALKALAEKYAGRALALLPVWSLIEDEFNKNKDAGSSAYFVEFKKRVDGYVRECNSYEDGADGRMADDIVVMFRSLSEHLESKAVMMKVGDGKAEMALRNLDKVMVNVTRGNKTVFEAMVENEAGSFYAPDTVAVALPDLDDGDYTIRCLDGKRELGQCHYPKFTLSVAVRDYSDGKRMYVADHKTGEPLEKVDVRLYKGDKLVEEVAGMVLDGFTRLPAGIASRIEKNKSMHYLVCSVIGADGTLRRSREVYLSGNAGYDPAVMSSTRTMARVMLDRAAFRPGETVRFKSVIYETSFEGKHSTVSPGTSVTVKLLDTRSNVVKESVISTNEFGSVAGEFVLDGIRRNGPHSIVVYAGGDTRSLGSASFVVDEFLLPSFDVSFEDPSAPVLPGETIVVKGCVRSYSGHSPASAGVEAKVMYGGEVVKQEDLSIAPDGSFAISFADTADDDYSYIPYEVEVKVTDLTGETLSFSCMRYVMRRPMLGFTLENKADGSYEPAGQGAFSGYVLSDPVAEVVFSLSGNGGDDFEGYPLRYRLEKDGMNLLEGTSLTGDMTEIDLSEMDSGLYKLVAEICLEDARGKEMKAESVGYLAKVADEDAVIDSSFENIFYVLEDDDIAVRFGAGSGIVWAVVELSADNGRLLESEMIRLEAGQMRTLRYDHKKEYPDGVRLSVLYFRNSGCHTFTRVWTRPLPSDEIPLEFLRFQDRAVPGSAYSIRMKTSADCEVLASVFDVSSEQIRKNGWHRVQLREPYVTSVGTVTASGMDGNGYAVMLGGPSGIFDDGYLYLSADTALGEVEDAAVIGYGSPRKGLLRTKASNAVEEVMEDVSVRQDFAATLAFEPFLRPSEEGIVNLDFRTSDKISSFVVSVFAHDRDMNNSVLRREMLVTLPVKVDVVQPQYLHAGDRWVVNTSLSSTADHPVNGVVRFDVYASDSYDGADPMMTGTTEVTVPAGGSVPVSFEIDVPSGVDDLGVKVTLSGEASDGVFVKVPVYPAEQVLTEAHSAVLLHGMSREALLESLRKRFVNVSSAGAAYSEVSLMDMLREALPLVVEAGSKDVVSQSEAMYVNLLAAGLRQAEEQPVREWVDAAMDAAHKVLTCVNADGGFGWFEGMKSSPVVTALVLERYAGLRDRRLLDVVTELHGEDALDEYDDAVTAAVKYLDSTFFNDPDRPEWYGRISLLQYMEVRLMYAGVPFDKPAAVKAAGTKGYKEFRKQVKALLIPKKGERWTDGAVLSKARMIKVIRALLGSSYGEAIAGAWGLNSTSGLRRSMEVELSSLKEYAVEHGSGCVYYPNAVLPFRGLLESEAYAHAVICDLFRDISSDPDAGSSLADMADSIRLWIMLQKETQDWSSDPGYVEAMASVYDGSDVLKNTRVMKMSKRYVKPFEEIKAAGNGFKVDVKYYREIAAEGSEPERVELKDGDMLRQGEKIVSVCSVWSGENRSFVRLSVPRAACFRPQKQLSGWSEGWLRPVAYGMYSVSPYAYREVKADRTLYWMDVFPEEHSSIEEVLFVTQEGRFMSPVAEIESLYAPHYRANDESKKRLSTL